MKNHHFARFSIWVLFLKETRFCRNVQFFKNVSVQLCFINSSFVCRVFPKNSKKTIFVIPSFFQVSLFHAVLFELREIQCSIPYRFLILREIQQSFLQQIIQNFFLINTQVEKITHLDFHDKLCQLKLLLNGN